MVIASNDPIQYEPQRLQNPPESDELMQEIFYVGVDRMRTYIDSPRLDWDCPYLITDNHPLVEYPGVVKALLPDIRSGAVMPESLPPPRRPR
jgi:hypothetical protein